MPETTPQFRLLAERYETPEIAHINRVQRVRRSVNRSPGLRPSLMRLAVLTALALVALNRPGPALAGASDSPGEALLLPRCQGDANTIAFEELRRHASGDRVVVRARLFKSPFCTRASDCSAPLALRSLGQPPPATGWTLLEPSSGWTVAGSAGSLMLTGFLDGHSLACVGEPGKQLRCPLPAQGEVVEVRGTYGIDAYANRSLAVESLCTVEAAPARTAGANRVPSPETGQDAEVPLSRCPGGVAAIPLEQLRHRPSGDRVTVLARLFVSPIMTCLDSLEGSCSAGLVLVPLARRRVTENDAKAVRLTGSVNGRDLTCTRVGRGQAPFRCPLPAQGERVKVRGTYLVEGYGERTLAATEICREGETK